MKNNNGKLINGLLQGLLAAIVMAVMLPAPAFAQDLATTVSRLVGTELTNIPDLIGAVYYIGGAAFMGAGLLKCKLHADNPTQTKLGECIGRLSVGAGLLALPYFANAVISTFGFGTTSTTYTTFSTVQ